MLTLDEILNDSIIIGELFMNDDRSEFVSDYLSRIKRILDDMNSSAVAFPG